MESILEAVPEAVRHATHSLDIIADATARLGFALVNVDLKTLKEKAFCY